MAKEKIDLSFDFDKDLDRELEKLDSLSFGEPKKPKNKREAVLQTFKDVGKGSKEAFKPNQQNIERMVRSAIPLSLTSEYMSFTRGFGKMKDSLYKEFKETKKLGKEAVQAVQSLFPKDSRLGKILDKLGNKLSDGMSPEDNLRLRESELQMGMREELADQFTKEATLQMLNQNIETKRHNSMLGVLHAISDNTTVLKNFSIHITNNYYRKSLELQYKTLFAMKENVAVTKALADQLKDQLENVVRNTALPEPVKMLNKEYIGMSIKQSTADRTKSTLYNMLGGTKLDKMFENLTRRLTMSLENFGLGLSTLIQGADAMQMMKDFGDIGQTKSYLAGQGIGNFARDRLARMGGEMWANTAAGKKAVFNAKNIMADPAFAALDKLAKRKKAGKNKAWYDKLTNGALSFIGRLGDSGNQYLGSIYDISNPNKLGATFDSKTQQSIVKIIPDLLSKIYSEVKASRVGGEAENHELTWDYNRQKLVNRAVFKSNIVKDYKRLATLKVSNPLGQLVGSISKFGKFTKEEKADLATAIVTFLISPQGSTSIFGLKSRAFLAIMPSYLRLKARRAIDKLVERCKDKPFETSNLIFVLGNIRNSIPSLQTQLDDLVSIGEADTARSLQLLERKREDSTFVVNRDNILKFISGNYGDYDESWEKGVGNWTDMVSTSGIKSQTTWMGDTKNKIKNKAQQGKNVSNSIVNELKNNYKNIKKKAKDLGNKAMKKARRTKANVMNTEAMNNIQAIGASTSQTVSGGLNKAADAIQNQGAIVADKVNEAFNAEKKPTIQWSDLNAQFYESYEYSQGYVTDAWTWAVQTGMTKKFEIIDDYSKKYTNTAKEKSKTFGLKDKLKEKIGKAKEAIMNAIAKEDPLNDLSQEERMSRLHFEMINSEAYKSGEITDFGDYLISQGRDPTTGLMSKWTALKHAWKTNKSANLIGGFLRFTRKVDRKIAKLLTISGPLNSLKFAGKVLKAPFTKTGRGILGKTLKGAAKITGDIVTQPFIQMYNAFREYRGLDPVFDGGFIGGPKSIRSLERKSAKGITKSPITAGRVVGKITSAIQAAGSKIWGFLFKPKVSLAEEAAKRGLSDDTQVLAAGLDRIANNLEAQAAKETVKEKKERAGNWLSRLGLINKKKSGDKSETTKTKGILGWIKEHKTGLTIAGGFLLIGGLLKGLGVTFDDVKNVAKGIWAGVQGVVSGIKWLIDGVRSIADKVGSFLPSWLGGNKKQKVIVGYDDNGNPITKEVETEGGASKFIKTVGYGGMALMAAAPFSGLARSAIKGLYAGGSAVVRGGYRLGQAAFNKVSGGALTKMAEKKAAEQIAKQTAKEAAKEMAKRDAARVVTESIANMKKNGHGVIARIMEAAKGFLTNMLAKIQYVWGQVMSKLKYLARLVKSPKLLASTIGTAIKKGAVKLGAMVAGAATGIGALLTIGIALYEIGMIIYYMWSQNLSFWEAVSKQFLGENLFDPEVLKKLGVTPEEMDQLADTAANSPDGKAVLYETMEEKSDGTTIKTTYYLRKKGETAAEQAAKKILGTPLTDEEKERYKNLASAIAKGKVSSEEKSALIQDIIKGKTVTIAGIKFGLNNQAISPGLLNPAGKDFKSYSPQMKERIMHFAWDVLEKTGLPFRISSGVRSVQHNVSLGGSKNGPHVRGYGIDLQHTDPAVSSDLTKIPGIREILEQNNLKLPIRYWYSRTGRGADEGWHVEPAEARPGLSTFGETGGPYKPVNEQFLSGFLRGTGHGKDEAPVGESDDASASSQPTLEELNKRSITGGSSTTTGGLSTPQGRSTTDTISKVPNKQMQDILRNAEKNSDMASVSGLDLTVRQGDHNEFAGISKIQKPTDSLSLIANSNAILLQQLEVQKSIENYLYNMVKNKANNSNTVNNSINSTSIDFDNMSMSMKNNWQKYSSL